MNQLKINEKGFSSVEFILVIIIIALIGAVGWIVYKDHHKSSSQLTSTAITVSYGYNSSIQKITYYDSGTKTQLAVKKQLYDFYIAWNKLASNAEQLSTTATATNDTYLTKSAQQEQINNQSYDLFVCSQEKLQSLVIENPIITGNTASVTLNSLGVNTSTPSNPIKLSLIDQTSGWLIDHVTCTF